MFDKKTYQKNYYKLNREAHDKTAKEWNQAHPDYQKNYYLKRKEHIKQNAIEYKHKKRELALKFIGDRCFICNTSEHLEFHEKHGQPHETRERYYLEHYKDFIPLCRFHHKAIHLLSEASEVEMIKALWIIELLRSTNKRNFI